ncbi:MAG: beta-ketoacyl-[acyl-carrier-protein] synthase family protein [Verrucomicrobiae bacterium]|nr:beta-ketoacyl-[acyl-carrier-protein] synthase family protein [Verrucomicrobiae bacterium]
MNSSPSRIVISGVGAVTAFGMGTGALWRGLGGGLCGIRPITLFDTASRPFKLAGEVPDFNPASVLGPKGLRLVDRTGLLALCAFHEALADAGLQPETPAMDETGVILGTTMASTASLGSFISQMQRQGPRSVNPAHFPNTVGNSPAGQVSIRFGIRGCNLTVSSGFASSFDAMETAARMLRQGRLQVALAGGVEELSEWTATAFAETGLLSPGASGGKEHCAPFDLDRNGTILGEGSVVFALELEEHARARGIEPRAEYVGGNVRFSAQAAPDNPSPQPALVRTIRSLLEQHRLAPADIDLVVSGASGHPRGDAWEARAILDSLDAAARIPVLAPKSQLGETFSASGAIQMAAALFALEHGTLSPTPGFATPDPACPVDCVPGQPRQTRATTALVTAATPLFHQAACILRAIPCTG